MKIAFIGLGNMGSGMARNLLRAKHDVTVWNRTPTKAEELRADNGKVAGLYLSFPRTTPFTLDDSDVEFTTRVGDLTVKTKFHLADMVLNGKLEL